MAKKRKTFKTPTMVQCLSNYFAQTIVINPTMDSVAKEFGIELENEDNTESEDVISQEDQAALNCIEILNGKIERLMDTFEDHEGCTVDHLSVEYFMETPCTTVEDLEKEYIKWYFEMGDLWIDDPERIRRNLKWGCKFHTELEKFVNK
jgi:hypothetical protein